MTTSTPSIASTNPASLARAGGRVAAALELAVVIATLEIGMWELCGDFNNSFRIAALPLVVAVVWCSHRRRKVNAATGDQTDVHDTTRQAWAKTAAVTMGLAALIPLLALVLRTEGEGFRWFWLEKGTSGLFGYVASKGAFIVVQQLLLQYFLGPCCAELLAQRPLAKCCAAIIFGLVHLPSLVLAGITTVASYCWLGLFARGQRIAPLAVSHLVLAILAHAALPERLTLNMRVGATAQLIVERYRVPLQPQLAVHFHSLCSDRYFAACGGTGDAFVAALYRDVLGRPQPATDAEIAAWRNKLAANARADVVVEFFNCQEFADRAQASGADSLARQIDQRLAESLAAKPQPRTWR